MYILEDKEFAMYPNLKQKYHAVRFNVPVETYRKFKVVCAQLDLSIPKQMSELMNRFVIEQQINAEVIDKIR